MLVRSVVIRCVEGAMRWQHRGQRLLVLIFHRVLPQPDPMYPYEPDVVTFRRQMKALSEDFKVLPLYDALRLQREGRLPPGAVAVTFDDGFADNVTHALPVLKEVGIQATFFVASGYLDNGFMFNDAVIEACRHAPAGLWPTGTVELGEVQTGSADTRAELANQIISRLKYIDAGRRRECALQLLKSASAEMPRGLMMSRQQVLDLYQAGMGIGGHTRTHPILARLDDASAEREIAGGRMDLAEILGCPVLLFAYPNGRPVQDYGARDVALVRKLGFHFAVSTSWGFSDPATDPLQIPRLGSWDSNSWKFSIRLALTRVRSRGLVCETTWTKAGR